MDPGNGGMMMMHMSFFWGKACEVLFSGWPGSKTSMYVVALVFVFVLALLVEFLSHTRLSKGGSTYVASGLLHTFVHTIRVGLAYLVMLALMSFNGGVFIAAIAGHAVGFLIFGSGVVIN
ncbi:hypothetical protein Sjap_013418 [Stephania japonica]|uniref:Copper transport protein n=1 Tax=Stephania japonica TaxID=461633 RepID=A0AAP0IXV9_9MAGN